MHWRLKSKKDKKKKRSERGKSGEKEGAEKCRWKRGRDGDGVVPKLSTDPC